MRILVLGGSGMLGSMTAAELRDRGHEVAAPPSHSVDITNEQLIHAALAGQRYAAIVNCTVRKDFSTPDLRAAAHAVNAAGPRMLSRLATAAGCRLIHVSTDAVFGGAGAPFSEDTPPMPTTDYARSKLAGEPADALVIRGSFVGPGRTSAPSLLERLARGETIEAGQQELWNGLTSLEFAEILADHLAQPAIVGIRHVHGPDVDRLTLAEAVRHVFALTGRVKPRDAARDLRLTSRFTDLQRLPITATLVARLERLKSEAQRLGLWPAGED